MIGIPEKYQLSPEQETYLIKTREMLEQHSCTVVAKWKWLMQYFSRPEIQTLQQSKNLTYYLDFWYGFDGHGLVSWVFDWDDFPFDSPEDKGNFDVYTAQYEIEEALGPDYEVPAGDDLAYREMRSDRFRYEQTEATFFQWYSELWQGNQLYDQSFYAFTVQNNSIMMFDLNRCCWEEFFSQEGNDYNSPYQHLFPRAFTPEEIKARIALKYTRPHVTYWRHIKLEGEILHSLALYENEIIVYQHAGHFQNPQSITQQSFETRQEALIYVQSWVDEHMIAKASEVLIPADIDWYFNDSVLHYDMLNIENPRGIDKAGIQAFEQTHQLKLPLAYKKFLRLYNAASLLSAHPTFLTGAADAEELNQFYWIDTAKRNLSQSSQPFLANQELAFADTKNGQWLLISCQDGSILIWDGKVKKRLCADFEFFLQSFFSAYDFKTGFEHYASVGDIEYFKAILAEGKYIDQRSEKGRTALSFACEHKQVALCEFLLDHGANPNLVNLHYIGTNPEVTPLIKLMEKYRYNPVGYNASNWVHYERFKPFIKDKNIPQFSCPEKKMGLLDQMALKTLELRLGITLPADYKAFLSQHNGQTPNKRWLTIHVYGAYPLTFIPADELYAAYKRLIKIDRFGVGSAKMVELPIAHFAKDQFIVLFFKEGETSILPRSYHVSGPSFGEGRDCFTQFLQKLQHDREVFDNELLAVLNRDFAYLENKVSENWSPNYCDGAQGTPLNLAIYQDDFEMVDFLLQHGASLNKHYGGHWELSPFEFTLKFGSIAMAKHLFSKGLSNVAPCQKYLKETRELIEEYGRDDLKVMVPLLEAAIRES